MTNLFNQNQVDNSLEKLEWNTEQKEQFYKNAQIFKQNYEQKLKNILPEDLVKKISGSFELNSDINSSLDSLKNSWISELNLQKIKAYLNQNISLSREDFNSIFEEIKNSDNLKNLDLRIWDIIWKAVKEAEKTENDELFDLAQKARKIQQTWNSSEKADIIIQLERALNWETWQIENLWKSENNEKNIWENDLKNTESQVFQSEENLNILNTWQMEKLWNLENNQYWQNEKNMWTQPEETDENLKNSLDSGFSMTDEWYFWIWWEKEEKWNFENQENQIPEKNDLSNNQFVNILDNLRTNWDIDDTKFSEISKKIWENNIEDQKDLFLDFVSKNISWDSRENILSKFKNNEKIDTENFDKTDFSKDIKWKLEIDKEVWGLEIMLAENYIYLPNKESSDDMNKEKSINTSMDVSLSKILNKNSTDFKKTNALLINDIKSEKNLDVKYKLLKELHKKSLEEDAKLGKISEKNKNFSENTEKQKNDLKERYAEIEKKIKAMEWQEQNSENKAKLENLRAEKQKIINEAKQVDKQEKNISQSGNISTLASNSKNESLENTTQKEKQE